MARYDRHYAEATPLAEAVQIPVARLGLLAGVSAVDDGFFGTPLEQALRLLQDASLRSGT